MSGIWGILKMYHFLINLLHFTAISAHEVIYSDCICVLETLPHGVLLCLSSQFHPQ